MYIYIYIYILIHIPWKSFSLRGHYKAGEWLARRMNWFSKERWCSPWSHSHISVKCSVAAGKKLCCPAAKALNLYWSSVPVHILIEHWYFESKCNQTQYIVWVCYHSHAPSLWFHEHFTTSLLLLSSSASPFDGSNRWCYYNLDNLLVWRFDHRHSVLHSDTLISFLLCGLPTQLSGTLSPRWYSCQLPFISHRRSSYRLRVLLCLASCAGVI